MIETMLKYDESFVHALEDGSQIFKSNISASFLACVQDQHHH